MSSSLFSPHSHLILSCLSPLTRVSPLPCSPSHLFLISVFFPILPPNLSPLVLFLSPPLFSLSLCLPSLIFPSLSFAYLYPPLSISSPSPLCVLHPPLCIPSLLRLQFLLSSSPHLHLPLLPVAFLSLSLLSFPNTSFPSLNTPYPSLPSFIVSNVFSFPTSSSPLLPLIPSLSSPFLSLLLASPPLVSPFYTAARHCSPHRV